MIPVGDRVLLAQLEAPGDDLWLPDSAGFLQRGLVLAVGELAQWVRKDAVVAFKKDDALVMRVPIRPSNPRIAFPATPHATRALAGPGETMDYPAMAAPAGQDNMETLYLISEPSVYLILEQPPDVV